LRLADITNLVCNVVVQEHCFCLVLYRVLIQHEVPLGEAIVVVQLIHFFSFSEAILNVFFYVEAVHIPEVGEVFDVEKFLLERVSIFSVINYRFSTAGPDSPFVVRLKEGDIKGKNFLLKID